MNEEQQEAERQEAERLERERQAAEQNNPNPDQEKYDGGEIPRVPASDEDRVA